MARRDRIRCGRSLQPRLIKIDVEGYEAGVLDGAWQSLGRVRPMGHDRDSRPLGRTSLESPLDPCWLGSFGAGYRLHRIHVDRPLEPVTLDAVTGELANYGAGPD
jgi:hypothetical protein